MCVEQNQCCLTYRDIHRRSESQCLKDALSKGKLGERQCFPILQERAQQEKNCVIKVDATLLLPKLVKSEHIIGSKTEISETFEPAGKEQETTLFSLASWQILSSEIQSESSLYLDVNEKTGI